MTFFEIIAPIYTAFGLSAISDPWIRALAVFMGALIYFILLSGICLMALPRQKPVRPIASWKVLLFLLFISPLFCVGLLLPFLLVSFRGFEESLIPDTIFYQSWVLALFVVSYLPGFILLWQRFRSYEVTPNTTVDHDARRNIARGSP